YPAQIISLSINRPVLEVYEYASNPENLPKWAAGLSDASIVRSGDHWIANSPMGKVKVRFVEKNTYGVMDHEVTLPSGEVNYNPFRVVKNAQGSEVMFTLFHLPGVSSADFERDAQMIEKHLKTLKSLLERERS